MNQPTTYSAAAKVAETVTTEELQALIAQSDTAIIWRGPGRHRYQAWLLRLDGTIVYTHCFRRKTGRKYKEAMHALYADTVGRSASERRGAAHRFYDSRLILSARHPIFHFERLGRIVRWEG